MIPFPNPYPLKIYLDIIFDPNWFFHERMFLTILRNGKQRLKERRFKSLLVKNKIK